MTDYACPSCGATVTLRSAVAVTAVCPYCRTLVVRHGAAVESIGTMAVLPDDISPLQISTTGTFGKMGFVLIGRAKIGWADGCWNEWLMLLDSGEQAWLAEAQGSLAISSAIPKPDGVSDLALQSLRLGTLLSVDRIAYTVTDIKAAQPLGYEGEFPADITPVGTAMQVTDLTSENGGFLTITCVEGNPPELFQGAYVPFNDLKLQNLRELPGWKTPRHPMPTVTAPSEAAGA
jgi:hypothetical protein